MAGLKIKLFGEFRVWRGGELIESEEWDRQKTRSLLKLLLTRRGHAFSKEEIVEALWPGVAPHSAEHSLRTTIGLLRRALERGLERGSDSRYVLSRRPGYSFNEQAQCQVDAWEFEDHRKKAEAALGAENTEEAIEEYRAAVNLVHGGELLEEEPYEEWAAEARQEWRERHLFVLSGLSECLAQKGSYTEAIGFCERALTIDKFSEELRRRLMLYRYCAGEQALALQTYRDYAKILEEELGTGPSPELARLKEQMEARDVPGVDTLQRYPKPRRAVRFPYSLSRTHFAGRDEEYGWLVERLRETVEGRGGAVAVEGEAGVGKTRLVEEFLGYAKSHGVRVLSGRCYERELATPLEPITEALGQATETDDVVSALSDHREGDSGGLWEANHYGVSRIYQALTGELIRASEGKQQQGLVLFLDDVQWADPATLDFIPYLARRILDEQILLVFTYRREEAPALSGWLRRLAERRAVRTVSLDRLTLADLAQILGRMSSSRFDALPSLTEFLHRHSEGNPFYATEYLRWLIEAGAVEIDSRRRIQALRNDALGEDALPSGVRSLIQARFSSLGEETREIVELASVVGRGFDLKLLSRAAGCDEDEAISLIEPLVYAGLIVETQPETYYFSHDKLRQVLYEDLGYRRRRKLHLRVAPVLDKDGGEPAELAHHYLRAQEWEQALEYLTLAAQKAEHGYAWETAAQDYAQASEVAQNLPGAEKKRFDLLASRERLLEHMDRLQERRDTIEEMFSLATRLGDRRRLAEARVRRIGVLRALSEPEGAAEAARAAISIYQELEDRAGEARVHRELGYVLWTSKDYAGALEANFQALRLHRVVGDRRGEAGDGGNIAQIYRNMKDYEQALRWAQEAARIDRELGDRLSETFKVNIIATVHQERGELEAALSLHLRALSSITELEAKNLQITEHMNCGRLYLRLGNIRAALEHFRVASRLSHEMGYSRDEGYSLVNVGVVLEQLGDTAGAERAYRKSVELLQAAHEESGLMEELFGEAEVLTLLGHLLNRPLDRPAEALEAFETAAEIYRELDDVEHLRTVLLEEGGLLWKMEDMEGSASRYEEVLDLAREHEDLSHEASALASLSVVYRDLRSLRKSLHCGRRAVELSRELEDYQAEAFVLTSLADSYRELGHYKNALSCLKRTSLLRQQIGDTCGEVGALRDLAKVYESLDDEDRARAALEEAARKDEMLQGMAPVHHIKGRS